MGHHARGGQDTNSAVNGGNGGLYGGGGGATGVTAGGTAGPGAQGIIRITYVEAVLGNSNRVFTVGI
jgi:hypothetical protein